MTARDPDEDGEDDRPRRRGFTYLLVGGPGRPTARTDPDDE